MYKDFTCEEKASDNFDLYVNNRTGLNFKSGSSANTLAPLCNTVLYKLYKDEDATIVYDGDSVIPATLDMDTVDFKVDNKVDTSVSKTMTFYVKAYMLT